MRLISGLCKAVEYKPLIQPHTFRGKPASSASSTRRIASELVIKILFKSTGVSPAAKITSTGTVVVNPILLIISVYSLLAPKITRRVLLALQDRSALGGAYFQLAEKGPDPHSQNNESAND